MSKRTPQSHRKANSKHPARSASNYARELKWRISQWWGPTANNTAIIRRRVHEVMPAYSLESRKPEDYLPFLKPLVEASRRAILPNPVKREHLTKPLSHCAPLNMQWADKIALAEDIVTLALRNGVLIETDNGLSLGKTETASVADECDNGALKSLLTAIEDGSVKSKAACKKLTGRYPSYFRGELKRKRCKYAQKNEMIAMLDRLK